MKFGSGAGLKIVRWACEVPDYNKRLYISYNQLVSDSFQILSFLFTRDYVVVDQAMITLYTEYRL